METVETMISLRRRQLDKQLKELQPFAQIPRPRMRMGLRTERYSGYVIPTISVAFGHRQPTITKLESSKAQEIISLKSLRKLAEAMDCTLVYALVPNYSLEKTLTQQAEYCATQLKRRVERAMSLEAQEQAFEEMDRGRLETAQRMVRNLDRKLWDI